MTELYDVFVRNWYKADGRTPNPRARKTYLAKRVNGDVARAMCATYNATHKPGKRSRKAEFRSI